MIRITGYVVPIFKIITAVILYQIRKQIQIPVIADFCNSRQLLRRITVVKGRM